MGIIKEFPGLQIDDFRTHGDPPLLCLLSHAHSDHLLGLDRRSYYGPLVYCTPTTRSLVLNLRNSCSARAPLKYGHLRKEMCGIEILQSMELDCGRVLQCGNMELLVTPIDAHHCPGSCMFLIQSQNSAVLYTGDIRGEPWHVDMLALHPSLVPYTLSGRQINVYMDNIYEQHAHHSLEYHSSSQGIKHLITLLDRGYPAASPLCALFTTIGYENVLLALSHRFSTRIHMDPHYYQLYTAAADSCPVSRAIVERATTSDSNSQCRIHWCKKGECSVRDQLDAVYFTPCVTISPAAVEERNKPLDLSSFEVRGHSTLPVYGDSSSGARYILGNDQKTLLPGHLLFYFSRHASQPCLTKLIETFSPKTVRSLDGRPMQGFSSFESSGKEDEITTDESQQPLPACLPLIRKQPVGLREKPAKKKAKYSFSSSSASNDEALMFLQGAGKPDKSTTDTLTSIVATPPSNKAQEGLSKGVPGPGPQAESTQPGLVPVPGTEPLNNMSTKKETLETMDTVETMETGGTPTANDSGAGPAPGEQEAAMSNTSVTQITQGPPLPYEAATQAPVPDNLLPTAPTVAAVPAVPAETELLDGQTWFSLKFDFQNQ